MIRRRHVGSALVVWFGLRAAASFRSKSVGGDSVRVQHSVSRFSKHVS